MKRLLNYLPFHFVVLLSLGIYSQFYDQFWKVGFLKTFILIAILLTFLVILNHKKISTTLSFLLFYLIGVSAVYFNNDVNYKDYYQNYAEKNSTIVLRVDKVLKSGLFNDKYDAPKEMCGERKLFYRPLKKLDGVGPVDNRPSTD